MEEKSSDKLFLKNYLQALEKDSQPGSFNNSSDNNPLLN